MSDLWQQALELQGQMTKVTFDTWLTNTTVELHNSTLTIADPSAYAKNGLEDRFRSFIERTVNRIAGQPLDIAFVVRNSITKERTEKHYIVDVRRLRGMGATHTLEPDRNRRRRGIIPC